MRDVIFVVCDRNGYVRTTKTPPTLKKGEVAVRIVVNVSPDAFEDRIPSVELFVPMASVLHPEVGVEMEMEMEE